MIRRLLLIGALCVSACAQEVPGVAPPEREVYFPIGAEVVNLPGAGDVLVVVSSNFDQRYNAGHVSTYSVASLIAMAGTGDTTTFVDSFEDSDAFISRVRIEQFGGDIAYRPGSPGRIFVASRGRNLVTMIGIGDDGTLFCDDSPSAPRTAAFDCTVAHEIRTFDDDPFAVAFVPSPASRNAEGTLAVGHVSVRSVGIRTNAVVKTIDFAAFDARRQTQVDPDCHPYEPAEEGEEKPTECVLAGFSEAEFINNGGVAGMQWSSTAAGGEGRLMVASAGALANANSLTLISGAFDSEGVLFADDVLSLDLQASAVQSRGLRVTADGTRTYVGVRFQEGQTVTQFNSGVAVVDTSSVAIRLLSVFEVGEEGSRPSLLERADGVRLLYIPDLHLDRVFILDVTRDAPNLVGSVAGLANRTIDGQVIQAETLASPTQIAFDSAGEYGFVTNFLNSTIAVLDLRDPDPRQHKLIARLGRNIDPEGDMEKPE